NRPFAASGTTDAASADIRLGTEILRLTLAYENLIHNGASRNEAVHQLSRQNKSFSPDFFQALVELDPNAKEGEIRQCRIELLTTGMIIQQEVRTAEGTLLISKGQEVTSALLSKLKNLSARRVIAAELAVSTPTTTLAFVKGAS